MSGTVRATRNTYWTNALCRLWNDPAGRPMLEQMLGPQLARELNDRLSTPVPTPAPWLENEEAKPKEPAFICRLDYRCQMGFMAITKLLDRPEEIPLDVAIETLGQAAPDADARQVMSVIHENGIDAIMKAGFIELADTVYSIHDGVHLRSPGIMIDVINLGGLLGRDPGPDPDPDAGTPRRRSGSRTPKK